MQTETKPPTLRLIDSWEVIKKLGVSHSTMERMRLNDINFPVPVRVGARSIRYIEYEIDDYIYSLPRADPFDDEEEPGPR
ncbi:helix-turn-helix transcriptional regulator [Roseovarius tibetensis]|uniref:helix-turn-helix transcriptional regulator n=1 Tax=Roseovarius tibetensis TaxID=2685897 RepID=UPI003D7FB592